MFDIKKITRNNITQMKPYSSARDEFSGIANVLLDANENPYNTKLNRYPDPQQQKLKHLLSRLKDVNTEQLFIGNGSDEAIDLLFRAFCRPNVDKACVFSPTYGMYSVYAAINDIDIVELTVQNDFSLPSFNSIEKQLKSIRLLFICSPNNPTGNSISKKSIRKLATNFSGLVILDEAYIDFSIEESAISLLEELPNLVVLQTLSKAWGLAGLRIGMAFASSEIIAVLNKIKSPYNINVLSQEKAIDTLTNQSISVEIQIKTIQKEREKLKVELAKLKNVRKVYPSEANFLLVEFKDSENIFKLLIQQGIVVRNRAKQVKGCLRISIGTPKENTLLLATLRKIN